MMNKRSDVIVVGGGVIGTSVAYYAAQAGHKVLLLDRGDVAAGTSGACDGFIILQSKNPGPTPGPGDAKRGDVPDLVVGA